MNPKPTRRRFNPDHAILELQDHLVVHCAYRQPSTDELTMEARTYGAARGWSVALLVCPDHTGGLDVSVLQTAG